MALSEWVRIPTAQDLKVLVQPIVLSLRQTRIEVDVGARKIHTRTDFANTQTSKLTDRCLCRGVNEEPGTTRSRPAGSIKGPDTLKEEPVNDPAGKPAART